MNIVEAANTRYSTKQFDASKTLDTDTVQAMKDLLRLSASSVNSQPWHFILTGTAEGKARVASACTGKYIANEQKILDASHTVVFCVKTDFTDEYIAEITDQEDKDGRIDSPEMKEKVIKVRTFYADLHRKEWNDTQCWMEKQVYLNMGSFLLGVGALGLDAVPIEGIDCDVLDTEFGLAEQGYKALAVVSVGYKNPEDFNAKLPKSRWPEDRIFKEY